MSMPLGWQEVRLGSVVTINPRPAPGEVPDSLEVTFLPMRAVSEVSGRIDTSDSSVASKVKKGYTYFRNDDVLFAKITPCMENGKIAVARGLENGVGYGSTEFYVLRCGQAIIPKFLFYILVQKSFREAAQRSMSGAVGQQRVPKRFLEDFVVALPPLEQQRQIVASLDTLVDESEKALQSLERSYQALQLLRQSILEEAFKISDAPTKAISDIANVGTGSTPLRGKPEFWSNGTIPWVTSGALNQETVTSASEFVTDIAMQKHRLKIYRKNTLLVALYGEGKTRGKCAELLIEATVNQAIATISLKEEYADSKDYLKWYLIKNYEALRRRSAGGVQPNLNLSIIKRIEIPFPDTQKQKLVIQQIEEAMSNVESLDEQLQILLATEGSLRQSSLRHALSGKLSQPDTTDSPKEQIA